MFTDSRGSNYAACVRGSHLLGQLAGRDRRVRDVGGDRFSDLSPKDFFEQACAIASKGYTDPVARALFVEGFCRAAAAAFAGDL